MKVEQLARDPALPEELWHVCAPVHKRALGTAVGVTTGVLIFLVTVFHLVVRPSDGPNIELLNQYFYGYSITWAGAVAGAFWGMVGGFVAGWFLAFVRNLCVAVRLWWITLGSDLANARDFLDHI